MRAGVEKGPPGRPARARAAGLLQHTALRRLNKQEWMLPCDSPSKSSMERWVSTTFRFENADRLRWLHVGYNDKLPAIYGWVFDHAGLSDGDLHVHPCDSPSCKKWYIETNLPGLITEVVWSK